MLWWLHVALLGLFAWTLVRAQVSRVSVARWLVLSLVPQAMLGIWQFAEQTVAGSMFFGIAPQLPWVSGVSVIEHGLYRVLRAYGGFPHPNIFGGWLALALVLLPELARRSRSKLETLGVALSGALFTLALVLTFSRGAWAAAISGLAAALWVASIAGERASGRAGGADKQALWLVMIAVSIALIAGVVSEWDHVAARFRPAERLERWSLEQRKTALEEGAQAWLKRPLVGWGPGAGLVAITTLRQQRCAGEQASRRAGDQVCRFAVMPEPPHAVPLVALVETGALGFLALTILLVGLAAFLRKSKSLRETMPIAVAIAILALSDHYLWTLWAGQTLAMLVVVIILLASYKAERHPYSTS